ncbi:MAG: hydrolase [Simkaniaceae bacterium]
MEFFPEFKPFPLIRGHFSQTIIGSFVNLYTEPPSEQKLIDLPDGDKISLEITTPPLWKEGDLIVMLIHGFCGSHQSSYMRRITNRLNRLGTKVIRFNLRGCGSGKGLARKIYINSGDEDVHRALRKIKEEYPDSPVILIGFSLGGNIAMKFAGERGAEITRLVEEIIAVSPPVDVEQSVYLLSDDRNWIYERYLTDQLIKDAYFRHSHFPDLPPLNFPKRMGILDFHEMYLAPQCGFNSAKEYHIACSSIYLIGNISVPCKILFAKDDPIVNADSLDNVKYPANVQVYKSPGGGHMGFLSRPYRKVGIRWLDGVLLSWIFKTPFF